MGNTISGFNASLESQLLKQLTDTSDQEEQAAAVSGSLSARENELLSLYASGEIDDEAARAQFLKENNLQRFLKTDNGKLIVPTLESVRNTVQIQYQRAMNAYQYLQTMLKNTFDTMMRGIQNLRVG